MGIWAGCPVLNEAQNLEISGRLPRPYRFARETAVVRTCFPPNWGNSDECAKRIVSRICGKYKNVWELYCLSPFITRDICAVLFSLQLAQGNNCFPGILRLLQTWHFAVSPIILLAKSTFMGESHPQVISHPITRVGYNGTKGGLIFHVGLIAPNRLPPAKKKERNIFSRSVNH